MSQRESENETKSQHLPLLVAALACLAALLYWDNSAPPADDIARPPAERGASRVAADPSGPIPEVADGRDHPARHLRLSNLNETVARPLFEPSRRPPPAPEQQSSSPQPVEPATPRYRLLGVVSAPDRVMALIWQGDSRPLSVGPGDMVDGWRVDRITPIEVTLTKNGQSVRLSVFRR
ncbi:MAG: hypothetical protein WC807_11635 [Hyphomicrobium sp.]